MLCAQEEEFTGMDGARAAVASARNVLSQEDEDARERRILNAKRCDSTLFSLCKPHFVGSCCLRCQVLSRKCKGDDYRIYERRVCKILRFCVLVLNVCALSLVAPPK